MINYCPYVTRVLTFRHFSLWLKSKQSKSKRFCLSRTRLPMTGGVGAYAARSEAVGLPLKTPCLFLEDYGRDPTSRFWPQHTPFESLDGISDLLYPSRLVFEKSACSWGEKMLFSILEHSNPAVRHRNWGGLGWERFSGIRTRHRHFGERVGMKSSLRLCAKAGIDVPVEGASRLPRSRRFSGLAAL